MPDRPQWYGRLETALQQIEAFPSPWIDRATLQSLLGVGPRRAQQILRPLVQRTIGKNGLAPKENVALYLRELATGEVASFERRRRERLHELIENWHIQNQRQPQVLVEAPEAVVNQELDSLPPGIQLMPGRIIIEGFSTPDEAKQKLLALILAMGNDPAGFDSKIT